MMITKFSTCNSIFSQHKEFFNNCSNKKISIRFVIFRILGVCSKCMDTTEINVNEFFHLSASKTQKLLSGTKETFLWQGPFGNYLCASYKCYVRELSTNSTCVSPNEVASEGRSSHCRWRSCIWDQEWKKSPNAGRNFEPLWEENGSSSTWTRKAAERSLCCSTPISSLTTVKNASAWWLEWMEVQTLSSPSNKKAICGRIIQQLV